MYNKERENEDFYVQITGRLEIFSVIPLIYIGLSDDFFY
jgi:hypothetical protein